MISGPFLKAIFAVLLIAPSSFASKPPESESIVLTRESGRTGEHNGTLAPKIVPNAFIVELNPKSSSGRRLEELHGRFYKHAEEKKVEYKIRHEFKDSSLFLGLSIELSNNDAEDILKNIPEVKKIWPVFEIPHPTPVGSQDQKIPSVKAPADGFNHSVIRGKDYKLDFNLKMAGIDRLHSEGIKGKGVKVAVIDSGVDYNHVALGGGFGPGKKVAFGRNYIDDGQGGPDDPIASCSTGGHGTHVAGIIVGEDPEDEGFGLLGVAPEATLGMYRVFACSNGANTDTVIQALVDAVNDGADIISLSLGLPFNTGFESDDPFAQVTTNAKNKGVTVVAAVGNGGAWTPFGIQSPSIGKNVVAVASVDAARYPTTYKVGSNRGGEWRYSSVWPLDGEFTVYMPPTKDSECAGNQPETYAPEVEKNGWDIGSTFFMHISVWGCSVGNVLENARVSGYKGVLIWTDHKSENPSENNYYQSSQPYNAISVNYVDGLNLRKALSSDPLGFRLQFKDRRFLPVDSPSAGFTSNFSTLGNTREYNVFKPLLAAPGHLILSTWPLEGGGYSIISGTSMATPFVAGCYALLKSAYPKLTIDQITNLFTTTAQPAKWWGDNQVIHTLAHQGAGTINAWNAYKSSVEFKQGVLVLPRSARTTRQNITLTNTSGRSKSFEVSHLAAGLRQTKGYAGLNPVPGCPSLPVYAKVDFESTKITLAPGETAVVSFLVTPPSVEDLDAIPQYSGLIKFSSGRDIYTVPYMGLPYNYSDVPALERDIVRGQQWPGLLLGYNESSYEKPIFAKEDVVVYDEDLGPNLYVSFYTPQPTETIRLDLVAANTTFEPTYYGFNTSNHINTKTPALPVIDNFGGAESFFPIFDTGKSGPMLGELVWRIELLTPEGTWTQLPAGDYRVLLRVLPFEKEYVDLKSWVSWLSPVMRLPEPMGGEMS